MAIEIVPHAQDKKDLVEAFNRTMKEAGSPWGFYVEPTPRWIPPKPGQKVWRELHLAIEDGAKVVGGYGLKPQVWRIQGEELIVADWQGPVSLGAIDNRYAALGLRLVRDMLKKQPLMYSWGHGGNEEPMVQLLRKLGWLMHETPFLFRVCRPTNFLRKNAYLRQDPRRAVAQDVLAFTGLGSLGLRALHAAMRLRSRKTFEAEGELFETFGPWADDLWERCQSRYEAIAVRDADTMNALLPSEHRTLEWPAPIRLRVRRGGRTLGWAVVLERQQEGDKNFGTMRLGMVADALALPEDAGEVVWAAFRHLRDVGVDMVMANQAHPEWIQAFVDNGFFAVPGRRLFCASPDLQARLSPWDRVQTGLFLSNLDGHGPML
ncbi:MAG: hypothetical protein ACFCGT_26040 [Sandaracinaceae bacterium]